MKKPLFILSLILALTSITHAAKTAPLELSTRQFQVNKPFQVYIKLPEEASPKKMPKGSGYTVEYLNVQHQVSRSVTIVNGQRTVSKDNSYIYIFQITPLKKGKIKVGSFTLSSGKEVYNTEAFVITSSPQLPASSLNNRKMVTLSMVMWHSDPILTKNKANILEVRVYTDDRNFIDNALQESRKLVIQKSIVYDISDTEAQEQIHATNINGKKMYYRVAKRYVIFPVDPGIIEVQPPVINVVTPYAIQRLKYPLYQLTVRDAGPGAGLVYRGDLTVEHEYYDLPVRAGDNQEYKLLLKGTGNLKVLSNPYAGVSISNIFISQPEVELLFDRWEKGKAYFVQTLHYRISTRTAGHYRIPELSINYLDNRDKKKSLKVPAFEITVLSNQGENTKTKGLASRKMLDKSITLLWSSPLFVAMVILFLMLPGVSFFVGKHRQRLEKDTVFSRSHHADKRIDKILHQAGLCLENQDYKQFYHLLYTHVLNYIKDKHRLAQGLKLEEVLQELQQKSCTKEDVESIRVSLKKWSSMAYSPVLNGNEAGDDMKQAIMIIKSIHH